MKDGFIKIGAVTPEIRPGDCTFNAGSIISAVTDAYMRGVRVLALPELCVTGATCGDLFLQSTLLDGAQSALERIVRETAGFDMICAVGLPMRENGVLQNCAAVFTKGEVIGVFPKIGLTVSERRFFRAGDRSCEGVRPVLRCADHPDLCIGVEFGSELMSPETVSGQLSVNGANVILCLSGYAERLGEADKRRLRVVSQSEALCCAYALSIPGSGESTTDNVFSGHCLIAENGELLAESELFDDGLITADIDLGGIMYRRRSSECGCWTGCVGNTEFRLAMLDTGLTREFPRLPFVPDDEDERGKRCRLTLRMQAAGLVKRVRHTGVKKLVLGISGGLDSTLALLVCAEAMLMMRRSRSDISAVTMPCFGTSGRTRRNAQKLCELIGAQFREVDITESVKRHLADIGHDPELRNTAYENAQARERTQVLMDIANDENGLVIGTGDLSELALGWATFAGDHISMYGVNASVPKTLIRAVVENYADTCGDDELCAVLHDILDTPVSPELLPAENGEITQKTEDKVGPYELHDFFLYYAIHSGYSPRKLFRVAVRAFDGMYNEEEILKWLRVFFRRFFSQQFKRSCMPDGAGVSGISLSPRGALTMPSDASAELWLAELDGIEAENE